MISVVQLGKIDYSEGLRLQRKLVDLRKAGEIGDVLLLLEHAPVITLGRNAKAANVLASPDALYDNIVLFNAIRAPDSTAWLSYVPDIPLAALAAHAAFLVLFTAASIYIWRRAPSLAVRCGLASALTLGVILAGPAAHHNYHLWWLPFYCVSLAAAF